MKPQQHEWTWLDASETVTLSELSRVCGLSASDLDELVDYGALVPLASDQESLLFSAEWVMPLRKASRLRQDFDLDLFSVAMALGYLDRIDALERQLQSLQARLPR
jgi:chaperone modulatory protein CbpM